METYLELKHLSHLDTLITYIYIYIYIYIGKIPNFNCVFLSCHISVYSEFTLYDCLDIKELFAQGRRNIWDSSDCNETQQNGFPTKESVLKWFAIFIGKHQCWSFFLKKLQVFTNVLTEHLSTTASGNSSSKNECYNFEVYYKTRTMKLVGWFTIFLDLFDYLFLGYQKKIYFLIKDIKIDIGNMLYVFLPKLSAVSLDRILSDSMWESRGFIKAFTFII